MKTRSARPAAVLVVVALVIACFTQPAAADGDEPTPAPAPAPAPAPTPEPSPVPAPKCIQADVCCKVCDMGKACGNSCISRAKVCHKGRGCSCDSADVCH